MNRHACTIIYSMYRVNALRTPSRLRAGYPTLLQWRGRYDFSRLKTSRVLPHTSVLVIECFLTRSMLFLKCIYTHYIQSFCFTSTISETLFKLITHCFCCLLRCVEFSRSLTMSTMLPDSASFIMLLLHMQLIHQACQCPRVKHLAWR